ncbi:hypothetical protein [Pseudomonas sp. CM27]|uniref:hypothetical protein n=1 Tax=Pseudomonas sp. CM27 TaxID=2738452 RepID=UPI00155330A4|nr:hypothetical protein [Pseudomonas sp. CM27]NQD73610.1 hypothetical protein [Pseudomonas sp. CM27]
MEKSQVLPSFLREHQVESGWAMNVHSKTRAALYSSDYAFSFGKNTFCSPWRDSVV